jgi:hypothetical protein
MQLTDFLHENRHHLTISLDLTQLEQIMSGLSDLQAAVTENTTVTEAAIAALKALPSGDSDATIESLAQTLASNNAALQAALTPAATTLTISPATLTDPVLNTPYSATLTASGGDGSYTFGLASGSSLPPGLSLSSGGEISGTPTTSGTYSFTIDVVDSTTPTALDGSQPYTMTF